MVRLYCFGRFSFGVLHQFRKLANTIAIAGKFSGSSLDRNDPFLRPQEK